MERKTNPSFCSDASLIRKKRYDHRELKQGQTKATPGQNAVLRGRNVVADHVWICLGFEHNTNICFLGEMDFLNRRKRERQDSEHFRLVQVCSLMRAGS